jgi:hypothetical protein
MAETYNGQDWATHTVSLLLENTYELYGEGRRLSQEDPTGESLGEWVATWFWSATDQAIVATRNDISRNEFDAIDWKDIAASLAAE